MLAEKPTILAIEDNLPNRRFITTSLLSQGYQILESATGKDALSLVLNHKPDTILLDLGLPDMDGQEVIKKLRTLTEVPIIILSARHEESEKVQALNLGADDYLTKPFSVAELKARLKVALRHAERIHEEEKTTFCCGSLKVDFVERQVFVGAKHVALTPIQYAILCALVKRVNKIVTHKQLLTTVWGDAHNEDVDYLRIYIYQLRHKLEENPAHPKYLQTIAGVGYRLKCQKV